MCSPISHNNLIKNIVNARWAVILIVLNLTKCTYLFKKQSVNDTEAYPWLGQVDCELKYLKSMRQFNAHARSLSNKLKN